MKLEIFKNTRANISLKFIETKLKEVEKSLRKVCGYKSHEVLRVVFIDAAQMKKLNHQYRSKNKVTDVLSFQGVEDGVFGELVFCMPVLREQAKQNSWPVSTEFLYLTIHGLLHLHGMDHERSVVEAEKMFSIQDRIFSQITGIPLKGT
ncbi:MAG: rRNA maturation RNase YbeY [Bdellovibrionales bacterium CG10_big_fil_rev_8_21_14_0_10_45_34]|nr:MAG: rRNA maturation RNase YbeY [Bdellovibrionales bacterium CG10_big_fil_rev_8_21_14_0_10_45_34]